MMSVDRSQPLPLYAQLERALLAHISEHKLQPGDRLPTELEIAETYSVSRATIRQALSRLVADGHIETLQGLGSFVAKPMPSHKPLLTSFSQNMSAQGYRPRREVLSSEIVLMPDHVAAVFGGNQTECLYLCRLLLADDRPIGVSQTWIPRDVLQGREDLFTKEALEAGSLYDLLQGDEIGLRLDRGTETIQASTPSEEQAHLLECSLNSSTLVVHRIAYTPSDRPIESTIMTFAGNRYKYTIDLLPPLRK